MLVGCFDAFNKFQQFALLYINKNNTSLREKLLVVYSIHFDCDLPFIRIKLIVKIILCILICPLNVDCLKNNLPPPLVVELIGSINDYTIGYYLLRFTLTHIYKLHET